MFCALYIKNGIAYIPTPAQTDVGYYLDIEPVEVISISDAEALEKAIGQTIARGHPKVAAPVRNVGLPQKNMILKYAKAKSVTNFEENASLWHLEENNGVYEIQQWQKARRGWIPDSDKEEKLPIGISLDEAIKKFVRVLQKE